MCAASLHKGDTGQRGCRVLNEELMSRPHEIERKSFDIITQEIGERQLNPLHAPIIKRVIHTTADFAYLDSLTFTPNAVQNALAALQKGATIVTDTNMALAGISKPALKKLGGNAVCFMADEEVASAALQNATTRAVAAMDKACTLDGALIFAIGNAPTALLRLCELIAQHKVNPALVIGVPVGFVNVVESKEEILKSEASAIVARGRKGGSNVAAAICNALLYSLTRKEQIF